MPHDVAARAHQEGVVSRPQVLAAGLGDDHIERRLRRREWARVLEHALLTVAARTSSAAGAVALLGDACQMRRTTPERLALTLRGMRRTATAISSLLVARGWRGTVRRCGPTCVIGLPGGLSA